MRRPSDPFEFKMRFRAPFSVTGTGAEQCAADGRTGRLITLGGKLLRARLLIHPVRLVREMAGVR